MDMKVQGSRRGKALGIGDLYRVYVGIVRQLVLWDIHINEDGSFCFGGHCIIPN